MTADSLPLDAPGAAPTHPAPPRPAAANTLPDLVLTVYGTPTPQGSKTPRPIYRGRGAARQFTGHVAMADDQGPKLTRWRDLLAGAAAEAMIGRTPLDGPLRLSVVFTIRAKVTDRPRWWPAVVPFAFSRRHWWQPTGKPDLDKLIRAVGDAMKDGGAVTDDALFVRFSDCAKVFIGDPDEPDALDKPGAVVRVWRVGVRQR